MAIKVTSVACGALGALSLYAVVDDPPADLRPVDNALRYGPAVLALVFALAGFSLHARPRLAMPALVASVGCVALFWILGALYAG
jgi:hypothetical protein